MTARSSPNSAFRRRTARCTAPSSAHAALPSGVLCSSWSGWPNRSTERMPKSRSAATRPSRLSRPSSAMPGMEGMGRSALRAASTKWGTMNCDGAICVSAARSRMIRFRRSRRGRTLPGAVTVVSLIAWPPSAPLGWVLPPPRSRSVQRCGPPRVVDGPIVRIFRWRVEFKSVHQTRHRGGARQEDFYPHPARRAPVLESPAQPAPCGKH